MLNFPTAGAELNRRCFLKKCGWISAGLTLIFVPSCAVVRSALPALPYTSDPDSAGETGWIQVLPNARIRFFCPRMEMGQGAALGLTQVVAEELNIDQSKIDCILPDTDQTPPFKMTVGSESIALFFDPVSSAAAQMREMLRTLAATHTGVAASQIRDGNFGAGGFILPDGGKLDYGELVSTTALVLTAAERKADTVQRYALEHENNYQAIAQPWKHPELENIVTGKTVYSRDTSLPDMLYGQVVRPPVFGAIVHSVAGDAAQQMPGVVALVVDKGNNFVGIVTRSPFVLSEAVASINVQWQVPADITQDQITTTLDVDTVRRGDDFEHVLAADGDISAGRQTATFSVTARYETPIAAHAAIEPRSGLAHVQKHKVEVWCGAQDPFFVQRRVAKAIGRKAEEVVVHTHRIGGGFGGRVICQATEEAAILSAVVGQAVRVQWDRQTEFHHNYFQPLFSHAIDAGVTNDGAISHWQHDFISSPIIMGMVPGAIAWVMDRILADEGTARGSVPQYVMPNRRIRYSDIRTPVPVGAWRGLGSAPNTFAIESMIDELAFSAGIDPFQFRLQNLPPQSRRLADVLRHVRELSGWGQVLPKDIARGVACAVYKNETAAAVVVEIEVNHDTKSLRVTKAWCAQDCGLVVNPDQVEGQIIGNVVWGCSMALKEEITIDGGAVNVNNFDRYEILRHQECPDIAVELVIPKQTKPVAVGESALAPVAPAIANAIFTATGLRMRRLPMNYGSVFSDV